MRRRFTWLLALLVSGSTCAAVCASPAAAGEQLTKRAFQKRANDLCGAANLAIGQVFNDALDELPQSGVLPPEVIEVVTQGALPIFRGVLDRIEDLDGPAAFEKRVDRMLDQYRGIADDIEDAPELAFSEDNIFEKPDKVAERLGLRRCEQ